MSGTKVDLDTLRAAIKEYRSVLEDLQMAHQSGELFTYVNPPGLDTPGKVYVNSVVQVGGMHQQANLQLQEVLTTRIEHMEATLRQYQRVEQGNVANLKPKD